VFQKAVLLAAVALTLPGCGVYGPKGNDTGGIIPWSVETEAAALAIANDNCSRFRKYARITSIRRVYGDYIAYECRFAPIDERHMDVVTVRG
jgi:hypothetical protein